MRLKTGLIVVLVAGFLASFAVAAPPSGKEKTGKGTTAQTQNQNQERVRIKKQKRVCRPAASLILRGKLVSVADPAFDMVVTQTNKHARSYKGKTITVLTNEKTKILRLGKKVKLIDLVEGDLLNVRAKFCKKGELPAAPLATRVVAKPAKPAS